jgi:hypothetical protein
LYLERTSRPSAAMFGQPQPGCDAFTLSFGRNTAVSRYRATVPECHPVASLTSSLAASARSSSEASP